MYFPYIGWNLICYLYEKLVNKTENKSPGRFTESICLYVNSILPNDIIYKQKWILSIEIVDDIK